MNRLIQLLCLTVATSVQAQTVVQTWAQRYYGTENGDDRAKAIAVGTNGNVFVAGISYDGAPEYRWVTIAYSAAGLPLWTNLCGPGEASVMATDNLGNVFVGGWSAGLGGYNGDSDYMTIAYSGSGVPLWTNRYSGLGGKSDRVKGMAVDRDGNVIVTGTANITGSNLNYITIKYSNAGLPLWTNRYAQTGTSIDRPSAVAVGPDGGVFVTGYSFTDGSDRSSFATVAYSATGASLWTNRYTGAKPHYDEATAIIVDVAGSVFVTGVSQGEAARPGYLTLKYSSHGEPVWTNQFNLPGSVGASPIAMTHGDQGNVYVTGSVEYSDTDYATLAYSNDGVALWTNRYNGPDHGEDDAKGILVDGRGNVIVTGLSGHLSFGSPENGYATIGYSSTGVPLWTNRHDALGGGDDDSTPAIAVDSQGNVIIAASSRDEVSGLDDWISIKYRATIPLKIQKLDNQFQLIWTNAAFGWTNLNFLLQTAPSISGTFTNIPGARSPYTNPISGGQQFFRLKAN